MSRTNEATNRGITLIALVITIIVLLILAAVSVAMLTGENSILTQADKAKQETNIETVREKVEMEVMGSYDSNGNYNKEAFKENLKNHLGVAEKNIKEDEAGNITTIVDGYEVTIDNTGKVNIKGEMQKPNKPQPPKDPSGASDPVLLTGMTAIYWDENGTEQIAKEGDTWYQYVAGNNQTDTKISKWANAKTADGSYWVWIPRYEYKILSGEGTSNTGKIDVKFIPVSQTTPDEGYKIHPAFTDGTNNKWANGEWDEEIPGIWVAKFEMSMETNGKSTTTENSTVGNKLTNDSIKMVSKPGVTSWRCINIGNIYTNCYNYDRNKESHLMKNSEWGAVAYLTHSQYGRNGAEITINGNNSCYTGGNSGEAYKTNTAQSSTGNVYGIYDLSGCANEYTAGYIINRNVSLKNNGASFTYKDENIVTESTKYATVYPYNTGNDEGENNYNVYKQQKTTRYGDAILETSSGGTNRRSWYGDSSNFPGSTQPFFSRGGYYLGKAVAGAFCFSSSSGNPSPYASFHTVLVGQ